MTTKPVVGVVGHGYQVPKHFGDLPVTGATPAYLEAIAAVGGRAVILPPEQALELLDLVDALVLTGGGDVDPARYGGTGEAEEVDPDLDEAEIALAHAAVEARLPLLGICRGMQILAVAFGGTLAGGVEHRIPAGGHEVRTAPGSRLESLLGTTVRTSALHHQAVLDPGPRWRASAWSHDGTIEAIEPVGPQLPVLGVQWHPEMTSLTGFGESTGPALFGWLISHHRADSSWKPTCLTA